MSYTVMLLLFRRYGNYYKQYKVSLPTKTYNQIIKLCKKYKISPEEYIDYWESKEWFYPQRLAAEYYFKEYKKHNTIVYYSEKDILLYKILAYKWLNGYILNKTLPIIEAFKKHTFQTVALKYSLIYTITQPIIVKYLDNSEVASKLHKENISIPYKFNVEISEDVYKQIDQLELEIKNLQKTTVLQSTILLFGGESI